MPTTTGNQATVERAREMIEESTTRCAQMAQWNAQMQQQTAATRRLLAETQRWLAALNERLRRQQ